jgi:excinuclease ABC subunit A
VESRSVEPKSDFSFMDKIIIKGAKEHNLKNVDVDIPKGKLVVITGVSGSGKSSLAFDTIYAEGQRRYVESLSSYARQFLGVMEKPNVEYIDGLSPAISIDQKTASRNPRSTVGTITEIYDYLRLLYSKIGIPYCPNCNVKIESQTIEQIVDTVWKIKDKKILILSPIIKNKKGEYKELLLSLFKKGYQRARIDKKLVSLDEEIELSRYKIHNIELVIDRVIIKSDDNDSKETRTRISESIENAVNLSEGEVIINNIDDNTDILFSENLSCPKCGLAIPEIQPNLFSFNSPYGACEQCGGLGMLKIIDIDTIYNPNLTIMEGAIYPMNHEITNYENSWIIKILEEVSLAENIPLTTVFSKYTEREKNLLFYGTGNTKYEISYKPKFKSRRKYNVEFHGIIEYLKDKYENGSDQKKREIEEYMIEKVCNLCNGARLNKYAQNVRINNDPINKVSQISIDNFLQWLDISKKNLDENKTFISKQIFQEIEARIKFLSSVGVGYLSLSRSSRTLAGGEAQRIRLASQIGSRLSGILYVLDEPSIGLHQKDNLKLISTLKDLRDLGNSVIVVEHDKETMENADFIIDMGKGAGIMGGQVISQGTYDEIKKDINSITGEYLNGTKKIETPKKYRPISDFITVEGAKEHNLKNITVNIPLGALTIVTGVSGSGKSTLINDILYPYLSNVIYHTKKGVGEHEDIKGTEKINKVIDIDQSPIGRTPRSNPATYTNMFTIIRDIFSKTRESKIRGYKAGRFSFNVKGGRCENCKGDGIIKIEMQFLPDVYVTCDVCKGKRYNKEALSITYKGKNIAEILDMTISEGILFFDNIHSIKVKLETLNSVGLGYMKLGQPATTLSGGESQRIKLATELSRKATGKTLYILDEPTTGLHFDDIKKLLIVINGLVDQGNSVVIIEHNMDVIKMADWIIDLGKDGGENGGNLIFEGRIQDLLKEKKSYTGEFLKKYI